MDRGYHDEPEFDPKQLYYDLEQTPAPLRRRVDTGKTFGSEEESAKFLDSPDTPTRNWSPALLRIIPTAVFGLVLLLLIIGLELFYRHSPYDAPTTGARFMWTYAPVAILMVVQWVWTAYDLQVKILIPWAAMSRERTPASNGWLLHYIGSDVVTGVLTALKLRHTSVLLTTLGLWSVSLASIVTTSLFHIETNVNVASTVLRQTTALDRGLVTQFDPAILADKHYLDVYLGRQSLNLSRSQWTTADDVVLAGFGDLNDSEGVQNLTAHTNGFSGALDCSVAEATYGGNVSIQSNIVGFPDAFQFFIDVDAAGCQVKYPLISTNNLMLCHGDPCYVGRVLNHTCPDSTSFTTAFVLVAMHNLTDFQTTAAVECSPSYSQYTMDVTISPSSSILSTSLVNQSTDAEMTEGWRGMVQWINATNGGQRGTTVSTSLEGDLFGNWGGGSSPIDNSTTECDCDPWLFLVAHGQNLSAPQLLDSATLLNATKNTFPGVFSSIAAELLMGDAPPGTPFLQGSVHRATEQLVARGTSVRIAQVALSVLLAALVGVYVFRPKTNLPMDPSSMAAQAFLLKSDHEQISAVIKDTATVTEAEARVLLDEWEFYTDNDSEMGFRIMACRKAVSGDPKTPPTFVKAPVWRPPVLHGLFKAFLCALIVGTIIALELAYRKSQRDNGFADSSSQAGWTTYIAPAYLFILGVLLSSYTFSVSTLEPLLAMHSRPQPARKSVRYSPAAQTNSGLLLHALKYRNPVGLACAFAILLVPFLKIIVSGLIVTETRPTLAVVFLTSTTTFNDTSMLPPEQFPNNAYMELPGEIFALSQIEKYQLPLPAWTTTDGAVAQVDETQLQALGANTTVTLPLEVRRAELDDCTQVTEFTVLPSNEIVLTHAEGPKPCNLSDTDVVLLTVPEDPGWFGAVSPLSCGGYAFLYGTTLYGSTQMAPNVSVFKDVTVVQCTSYSLTTSKENVTLDYEGNAPKILSIDRSTAQNTTFMESFPLNETGYIAQYLQGLSFESNSTTAFDPFFQVLTLKNTSVPLATFLDPAHLTAAVQSLYTTYWAVHASLYQRLDIPSADQQTQEASVTYHIARIVQAPIPTHILSALFACILACILITVGTVRRTNNVLTQPPYSIGATVSLLVDSAFVELKELGDVRDEKDLERVLDGYEFQLGWGSNPKGGLRFGVDIVKK
ncbi:hypothetical protein FB45DRAFT_1064567 [Roridomyces roridus]|uniref:Uncharacterized protein n=1 Tax=Roridomyces roridus TaxID=1738132 RepID=A0AAD7FC55_9AGAR|nr:hypothetical protein FB45DRAFT_1064567 [Roridomyces roridus]